MSSILLTPFGIVGLQRLYGRRFEYRLHEIELIHGRTGVGAAIYDGDRKIFEAHGTDDEAAIREAKRWIDEQDEIASAYDLHRAKAG